MNTSSRSASAFTLTELLAAIAIISLLSLLALGSTQRMLALGSQGKCLSNLKQLYAASVNFAQDHDGCVPQHFHEWSTDITAKDSDGFGGGGIAPYIYPERVDWPANKQADYRNTVFQDPAARPDWKSYSLYSGRSTMVYLGALKNGTIPNPGGVEYARNNDMGGGSVPIKFVSLPKPSHFLFYVCASQWNVTPDAFLVGAMGPERLAPRHNDGLNMIFADGHAISTKLKPGDPEYSQLLIKLNQQN